MPTIPSPAVDGHLVSGVAGVWESFEAAGMDTEDPGESVIGPLGFSELDSGGRTFPEGELLT